MKSDRKTSPSRMTVTGVEEFLREPPAGFTVQEAPGSGRRLVHSDPEESLVLIGDFHCCRGEVVFVNSPGRTVKVRDLWEYTSMRNTLLSKRIYLLMSATEARELKHYVVSIDGGDPLIRWQMERGLDWTISSVAGESYRVDIDLTDALESWAATNFRIQTKDDSGKVAHVWSDASFTLKYHSDALFDFPHWFGFSKRTFKVRLT